MHRSLVSLALLLGLARLLPAADPVFDARGFSPNREFASDLAFEHVDPLNGNLLLTFTDLVLPGNAGFDLRIQRTYNIKIYELYSASPQNYVVGQNDPAGLGWTLHLGKVTNIASVQPGPTVEMPDGGARPSFRHMDDNSEHFMTRDLWTLNVKEVQCESGDTARCPVLRLPNGIRYVFTHGNRQVGPLYVTDIVDPFGNSIHVDYEPYQTGSPAYIRWVEQRFATGGSRQVQFTYEPPATGGAPVKRLSSIRFGNRVWRYDQQAAGGQYTLLTSVQPPEGPSWGFAYYGNTFPGPYLMQRVTTPHAGTLGYTYQAQTFFYGSTAVTSPALRTRATGGFDVAAGTTQYAFSQQAPYWNQPVVATVTEPCRTTTYETWAIGPSGDERPWRIGALKEKRTSGGGASQTETYEWVASTPISPDPESGNSFDTHAPLLFRRTLQRDGVSHSTTHTYHASAYSGSNNRSFNDYGHAERTDEVGPLSRITTRRFFRPSGSDFSLGTYIAGKVDEETVTVAGESFTRRNGYRTSNGFLEREDVYGIVTTFTPDAGGNVRSRKDARNNITDFTWRWGVPETMRIPQISGYAVTRVVDGDSTIRSQTRRGFTTRFEYDGLFRQTVLDPPEGDSTTWSFASDGRTVTQRRGPSSSISTLDGFGRVSATVDSQAVRTDTSYDACGRTSYQSFPFTTANIGNGFAYDGLDRLRIKTNPGATQVTYGYSGGAAGSTVTITDEESRVTRQVWKAFGDPGDARLASVTDAAQQLTSYAYNALGSLRNVDSPSGPDRTWTYNSRGLLETERHPENGLVRSTYYANGLLETRTDEQFRTTRFLYDPANRLTLVDRDGIHPDTEIAYDTSDNRTFLRHGSIRSELGPYDGNERLRKRVDTLGPGSSFTTLFDYDGRDNLQQITYPSSGRAVYAYNSENDILSVTDGGGRIFADRFEYHPSGGVSRYFSGNGIENRLTYHAQRYWVTGTSSGPFMQFGYGHDRVGNVTSTTHVRSGDRSYDYGYGYVYDALDRLRSASTTSSQAWGNLTFDYDPLGNRRFKTATAPTSLRTDYVYSAATNRLTQATGAEAESFEYDGNGNMVRDGAGIYTYNADNMMATARVGQVAASYGYDGDNLRKTRKVGDVVSFYVHGPGNQLLSEMERTGSGPVVVKRDYIHAGPRLIATVRPPNLAVSTPTLVFAGVAGGPSPAPQSFIVREASGGTLSWQATETTSWLTISPSGGSTAPASVSVAVSTSGLAVGTYVGTVVVTSPGAAGSPREVTVRLVVTNEAGFVVQPGSLAFDMTEKQESPAPDFLYALVSGGPDAQWTATTSESWISVSPASGTTPAPLTVAVDGSAKRAGTHRGWVKLDAGTTPLSPRYVPITLVVRPGPGGTCADTSWFCETFDDKHEGDLGGQGSWEDGEQDAQVVPDARGQGHVAALDPPPNVKTGGFAPFPGDPSVEGSEISVQLMSEGVADGDKQVGKIEFFTAEGQAWGKTTRTFAALRFGSTLYLQWGPNIYQVLVHRMESGRWYDVRVAFQDRNIYAFVDGALVFQTANPLAEGLPVQAFALTGWDYPGAGYLDVIEGRGPTSGLVVSPPTLAFVGRSVGPSGIAGPAGGAAPPAASKKALPLHFEPNPGPRGSADGYLARAGSYDVFLTPNQVLLSKRRQVGAATAKDGTVRLTFPGGKTAPNVTALDPLPGKSHYYLGNDPSRWRTNVPHFARVRYEDVYPGVNVIFYGSPRQLEYDLVLAPGVDPGTVRIAFEGADDLRLQGSEVVLRTASGEMRQLKPVVYQVVGGSRRTIASEYVLRGRAEVGFQVADYDKSRPLVLDPVLVYSTYLGGTAPEEESGTAASAIAVDDDLDMYVTGITSSPSFPLLDPAQGEMAGSADAFISRFTSDGSALLYSTFLGGFAHDDNPVAVALDPQGNAYVAGTTGSLDFPQVSPIQPGWGGGSHDGFVAKLNPAGQLVVSSLLGGPCQDIFNGLAVDGHGSAYVTGTTCSTTFLWAPAALQKVNQDFPFGHATDTVVARVLAAPTFTTYLTYLNGSGDDWSGGMTVDGSGAVYITGETSSDTPADRQRNPFPASPGAYQAQNGGNRDVYVARLNPAGQVLEYATFLGGADFEGGHGIALEPDCTAGCNAYVTGVTASPDFPVTVGAWSSAMEGTADTFLTKLSPDGTQLSYSTFLAGTVGRSVAVNTDGEAYVAGLTPFDSFPDTACPDLLVLAPSDPPGDPTDDVFVIKVNPGGTALPSCALLGGAASESLGEMVLDPFGGVYVAGFTPSEDFPTTEEAFQRTGSLDAFVLKLNDTTAAMTRRMQFASATYRVLEGEGQAVITVNRTGDLAEPSSVYFRTTDGSARDGADYQHREHRLTFGAGESALAVTVPVIGDTEAEKDETVNLTLSDPQGGELGFRAQAVLTIGEDDGLTRSITISDRAIPNGPPSWRVLEEMPWLSVNIPSGSGPATLTVTADPRFLAPGTYTGTIIVEADAEDSPQFVHVTFRVLE